MKIDFEELQESMDMVIDYMPTSLKELTEKHEFFVSLQRIVREGLSRCEIDGKALNYQGTKVPMKVDWNKLS